MRWPMGEALGGRGGGRGRVEAGADVVRGWAWWGAGVVGGAGVGRYGAVRVWGGVGRCGAVWGGAVQGRTGQGRAVVAFSAAGRLVVDGGEHITEQQLAALRGQPMLLHHAAAGDTPSEGGRGSTSQPCRARMLQGSYAGASMQGLVCRAGVEWADCAPPTH